MELTVSQYAIGIAAGNPDFIRKYYDCLRQQLLLIEPSSELVVGLRNLLDAITYYYQTHFDKTSEVVLKAIDIFSKIKHQDLLGLSYMIFGANCRSLGEIDRAVNYLYKGIDNINASGNIALYRCYCYYQLAEINMSIYDYQAARSNYLKAEKMAENIKDASGLFRSYNGLGNLNMAEENYPEALEYFKKTLDIRGVTNSERSRTFCDLGVFYYRTSELKLSKEHFEQSINIRKEANLMNATSTALIGLGATLIELEEIDNAISKLDEALEICILYKAKQKMMNCYHLLAQAYLKNKLWESATYSYQKYDELNMKLSSNQLQKIYKLKNDQIAGQKEKIEHILEDVKASIAYAKRIQAALLPPIKTVKEHLKESFILYKPKDIVAGDFYWMEHKDNKVLFAAADCTGHGVPGAMVSVVCNNALNRSVREYGLTDPGEILTKTREIVIQEFEKSEEDVKDGMDIALCSIVGNKLQYAGALNPLWIIRNGGLLETKANKQPIGQFDNPKPYTMHSFDLEQGDSLYIFSDGYVDQFGGEKGKKFKAKAFRELLLSIQDKSMEEQKTIIDESFETWKGSLEQIDDVCVIGVRV